MKVEEVLVILTLVMFMNLVWRIYIDCVALNSNDRNSKYHTSNQAKLDSQYAYMLKLNERICKIEGGEK